MAIETYLHDDAVLTIAFANKSLNNGVTVWVCENKTAYKAAMEKLSSMDHIEILQSGISHVESLASQGNTSTKTSEEWCAEVAADWKGKLVQNVESHDILRCVDVVMTSHDSVPMLVCIDEAPDGKQYPDEKQWFDPRDVVEAKEASWF